MAVRGGCGARAICRCRASGPESAWLEAGRACSPHGTGQVWAYEFVQAACANGQKIKCLTVTDELTKVSLPIDLAGSLRLAGVVEVQSRLVSVPGAPRYIRSYNGPESVSTAIQRWAKAENIDLTLSNPGKPWQNGVHKRFNRKIRDECLSLE